MESKEQKIIIEHHFFRLLIHGFLHLLGFDHQIEKDAYLTILFFYFIISNIVYF